WPVDTAQRPRYAYLHPSVTKPDAGRASGLRGRRAVSSTGLLLRGGTVIVGVPAEKNFADVEQRLRAGRIAEIGSGLAVGDAEVVDYSGCWIIPGFDDAHQHVWQSVLRGMLAGVSHDAAKAEIRRIVASSLAPDDGF